MKKSVFRLIALAATAALTQGCARQSAPQTTASAPVASAHHHEAGEGLGLHNDFTALKFSSQPAAPRAGQKATWTLRISDSASGKPVANFVKMHDRLMHLIVVSRDLSFYQHLHPRYQGDGVFTLDYALPRAGDYRLYADYVTQAKQHEVAHADLSVTGANPLLDSAKLTPDAMRGAWMLQTVRAHDEGQPPAPAATQYQVALMPMPAVLHAGEEAMLHFQVRDAKGQPLGDLMPYMGALGHAVILSEDNEIFLHTHPMEGAMAEMMGVEGATNHDTTDHDHDATDHDHDDGAMVDAMTKVLPPDTRGGPNVIFHTTFPRAGTYRVWGQFMRAGKVLTAPFTLRVLPAVSDK